jgi:alpha-mannosidase
MFFTVEKLEKYLKEIKSAIIRDAVDIPRFKYIEGLVDVPGPGPHCPEYDDSAWPDFTVGSTWGGYDVQAWFRAWIDLLPPKPGQRQALRFLVGPRDGGGSTAETLLYVNGFPLQGIDIWHEEALLPPEVAASGRVLIALKAWSGVLEVPDRRRFKLAQVVSLDEGAERYFYLAETLLKSARLLDENDLKRVRLLELLNASLNCISFLNTRSDDFYRSLEEAVGFLSAGLSRLAAPELKPRVTGVGHSHIDMAWLWRLAHTREKASRTFTTVLNLMRQYPEYHYMHSSPQLYKFLKEDYPEIYQQIRRRVKEGRWEVTGGMWVEADTNLTGGESLIRQFLFGRRFIKEEFGQGTKILWLPDVFGYSAALPQIVKKCGLKYFLTSKISWSQFNRFPHDTFYWRGIDGTELLTHFITTPDKSSWFYTYNGQFTPDEVKGIWDNYRQKEANEELLLLYGWGDGGGGPTREMLESARAMHNIPGVPKVELGASEPYFERLEQRLRGRQLPLWDGELYLEYHRGTYTSQAFIKRANRKAEILYHDAEWLNSLAGALGVVSEYPSQVLNQGWERILLNQFHDILPGSSIHEVYEDSHQDYELITKIGATALEEARCALISEIKSEKAGLVAFNSLSWDRPGMVELPWSSELAASGIPTQTIGSGEDRRILVEVDPVSGLGYDVSPLDPEGSPANGAGCDLFVAPNRLDNAFYSIELNQFGQIHSLYDKRTSREVIAAGQPANVLQAFEDRPMNFDAWDIDIYYQDKVMEVTSLVEAVVEENGPLRGVLRLVWSFGGSTITQRLTIYRSSPRIDFRTQVDWRERQVLLKAGFPVSIRATRATYDIQFGSVERANHWNTSWDYARFEVPAHKWADLSEGDYGVALLNDCKYGYDVKDNLLRLTLIKSAIHPDPAADQGEHVFTYSLLPHEGDWRQGKVVEEAYQLNYPLDAALIPANPSGKLPGQARFASLECDHVIVETVKKAEDGDAWIVRLYENQQRRSKHVRLSFDLPLLHALECNLVEEDENVCEYDENSISFDILPFEIKTFKVWFKRETE